MFIIDFGRERIFMESKRRNWKFGNLMKVSIKSLVESFWSTSVFPKFVF